MSTNEGPGNRHQRRAQQRQQPKEKPGRPPSSAQLAQYTVQLLTDYNNFLETLIKTSERLSTAMTPLEEAAIASAPIDLVKMKLAEWEILKPAIESNNGLRALIQSAPTVHQASFAADAVLERLPRRTIISQFEQFYEDCTTMGTTLAQHAPALSEQQRTALKPFLEELSPLLDMMRGDFLAFKTSLAMAEQSTGRAPGK